MANECMGGRNRLLCRNDQRICCLRANLKPLIFQGKYHLVIVGPDHPNNCVILGCNIDRIIWWNDALLYCSEFTIG